MKLRSKFIFLLICCLFLFCWFSCGDDETSTRSSVGGSWTNDAALAAGSRPYGNYYNSAYGLTNSALKSALKTIITSTHTVKTYSWLWTIYYTSDVTSDGKVWDMYSANDATGTSRPYTFDLGSPYQDDGTGGTSEGQKYNREHTWPKSLWGGSTTVAPGCDAHQIPPTDKYVNNQRGSYSYGETTSPTATYQNGSKRGPARSGLGFTGTVFEPIDAYKGDFARMHFYMAVRYYGDGSFSACDWADAGAKLKAWYVTMLKSWHALDPVSDKERNRNNIIAASSAQGNRNPFIDYPDLVDMIDFSN